MSAVILGGGIGGLAAAHYLTKVKNVSVTLVESTPRVGGWLKSISVPGTNIIFEKGPRTLRHRSKGGLETLAVIEDVELEDSVVPIKSYNPAAKNRFIYAKGKVNKIRTGLLGMLGIYTPFTKPLITAMWYDITRPPKPGMDDSIYDFVDRRLGREVADYLISPVICGICAGNAKEISVHFLFTDQYSKEQAYGSIIKGVFGGGKKEGDDENMIEPPKSIIGSRAIQEKWSSYYISGGIEKLTQRLRSKIEEEGVKICLSSPCTSLDLLEKKVKTKNGEISFDHVISTLPSYETASLLSNYDDISKKLDSIKYVSVGVVNLAYTGQLLKHVGFGVLVPPIEKLPILGITFDSVYQGNEVHTILTVMMGGYWFEEQFGTRPTDEKLFNVATKHVELILGISDKPAYYDVSVNYKCIPQYVVGHIHKVKSIRDNIKEKNLPLSLVGSAYDGVSINEVVRSARIAVDNLTDVQ